MEDDVLKQYLGKEYTDNPIVNFLLYSQKGRDTIPTLQNMFKKEYFMLNTEERNYYEQAYNQWRRENDLDVLHLAGDLNADTIISVWMPLKMCLQSSTTYPYSEHGNNNKPYRSKPYLPNIIKNIDIYLPRNEWTELYKFVSLASTKANVMWIPDSKMQNRGNFYDQMPKTLYECFGNGIYHGCFNKVSLMTWVESQKLKMFFAKEDIAKHHIKPLISRMKPNEVEWLKNRKEIEEMLRGFNELLGTRKKRINN